MWWLGGLGIGGNVGKVVVVVLVMSVVRVAVVILE